MVVYLIRNRITGHGYVGKTVRLLSQRWSHHLCRARKGQGGHLHAAIREYGPEVFSQQVISVALNLAVLGQLEKFWIRELSTLSPDGYNLTEGGDIGFTYIPETRHKMRLAKLGRPLSLAARAKMTIVRTGKKQSPQTIAKRLATQAAKRAHV